MKILSEYYHRRPVNGTYIRVCKFFDEHDQEWITQAWPHLSHRLEADVSRSSQNMNYAQEWETCLRFEDFSE